MKTPKPSEITPFSPFSLPERVSVPPKQEARTSQAQDDGEGRDVAGIRKRISRIPSGDKAEIGIKDSHKENILIKSLNDLRDIKGSEARFDALFRFAGNDRKKQDQALDWAEEVWKETAEAYLLDILRDTLAKKV